jgi:hypothetical protein
MNSQWFNVDKAGLAKLLEKKGKSFAVYELIQNAWDTDTKSVTVWLKKIPGRPAAELEVRDDDPDGFLDMSHAYTLFAESCKKDNPTKRGRFNLGEKLVLALCRSATIRSTKGSVHFKEDGTRTTSGSRTTAGSVFEAEIKMTEPEFNQTCEEIQKLIPPTGITTMFNGVRLTDRPVIAEFEAALPTIRADEEGNLTRTTRRTTVRVFEVMPLEEASIYEMGIPVVATGDRYHLDVQQKVPINLDRDNVPPGYLRQLRALALNCTVKLLTKEEATAPWVTDAMHHPDIAPEAVETVLTGRFGTKRAAYDPNDPEANNRLVSEGYTIVHGGTFGKEAWENIRNATALRPSGDIRPTPKPWSDDPNADPAEYIPEEEWTGGMREVADLAERLAQRLMDRHLNVVFVKRMMGNTAACYGHGGLTFSVQRLGKAWFTDWRDHLEGVLDLLIHEFGHEYESNHLSDGYNRALSRLGGKLAALVLQDPKVIWE